MKKLALLVIAVAAALGFYGSGRSGVIDKQIQAMEYAKIDAGISSWWGQGTNTDTRFPYLLRETDALSSTLRWAPYYEQEGYGDPSAGEIENDLSYIKSHYASDPAYLRVDGR